MVLVEKSNIVEVKKVRKLRKSILTNFFDDGTRSTTVFDASASVDTLFPSNCEKEEKTVSVDPELVAIALSKDDDVVAPVKLEAITHFPCEEKVETISAQPVAATPTSNDGEKTNVLPVLILDDGVKELLASWVERYLVKNLTSMDIIFTLENESSVTLELRKDIRYTVEGRYNYGRIGCFHILYRNSLTLVSTQRFSVGKLAGGKKKAKLPVKVLS